MALFFDFEFGKSLRIELSKNLVHGAKQNKKHEFKGGL